ncbi:MAG TPA: hypothetical protein ENI61_06380 [Ignavibacteria bacterium]|nr:hypothetical protein [Ignavibacteria bacterium]
MNNDFLDILIILIIVFSFFSPFFKKKKSPKSLPPMHNNDENETNLSNYPKYESDSNKENETDLSNYPKYEPKLNKENEEIFKEVEILFKGETSPSGYETGSIENQDNEIKDSNIQIQYEAKADTATNDISYSSSDDLVSKSIRKIDSQIEKDTENFERVVEHQMDTVDTSTIDIKSKLRDINLQKELIAISEILGKPKALRR